MSRLPILATILAKHVQLLASQLARRPSEDMNQKPPHGKEGSVPSKMASLTVLKYMPAQPFRQVANPQQTVQISDPLVALKLTI